MIKVLKGLKNVINGFSKVIKYLVELRKMCKMKRFRITKLTLKRLGVTATRMDLPSLILIFFAVLSDDNICYQYGKYSNIVLRYFLICEIMSTIL